MQVSKIQTQHAGFLRLSFQTQACCSSHPAPLRHRKSGYSETFLGLRSIDPTSRCELGTNTRKPRAQRTSSIHNLLGILTSESTGRMIDSDRCCTVPKTEAERVRLSRENRVLYPKSGWVSLMLPRTCCLESPCNSEIAPIFQNHLTDFSRSEDNGYQNP